jgi:5,10-methylenetetrahydromethanopterin reductase
VNDATVYPELGCYSLPGNVSDAREVAADTRTADSLGLGSVWIAERFGNKDAGVLAGAAAISSERIGIATGVLGNLPLRHPLASASLASTLSSLCRDRFALGIGRGLNPIADATKTPHLTFELLEAYISALRALWRGEKVRADSSTWSLAGMTLGAAVDPAPPIIMAAMGEKTCYWAGRHCDGVVLNSLWSKDAVARSVQAIRNGATDAGRDPAAVRVWAILVTACEVPEETMLETIIRRLGTYVMLPSFLEGFCIANGWDRDAAFRVRDKVISIGSGGQHSGPIGDEGVSHDLDDLRRAARIFPEQWISDGCAVGSAEKCAKDTLDRFEAGADGVLFHGSAVADLAPLVRAWREFRPINLGELSVNPGRGRNASQHRR